MDHLTGDASKFKNYKIIIDAYNRDKVRQMEIFDLNFYNKCLSVIPKEGILDQEPINSISFLSQLLTDDEFKIVNYSIDKLLKLQLSRDLSAIQIIKAYIKASIIGQISTNCVLQFLFEDALEQAKRLDKYLSINGKLIGPLHGIPVSVKEQMNIKGKKTHGSYVAYLENIAENDAISIHIIKKLGAVLHVRTSQPQSIMHLDTWNNINGRTRNPYSTKLSPGGSSGGESALIAMHGSVIGHGSDIGGSIRVPAAFTNLFGIRPTTRRLSLMNGLSGGAGQESILAVQGPLAKTIDELEYYMESYINKGKPWEYDPMCIPLLWRSPQLPKKLRIGVLFHDNLVTPYPAIKRGLETVISILNQNSDFEIIDLLPHWFTEEEMIEIYELNLSLYTCDGNKTQLSMLERSGEPILPLTKHFLNFGDGIEHSIYENRMFNVKRNSLKIQVLNNFYKKLKLDFILSPTYVGPSEIPGQSLYWGYTSIWNFLDYPNVVFPTGVFHDVNLDEIPPKDLKLNKYERMVWYDKNGSLKYASTNYIGVPVSLQLTGKCYCDEDVVAATKRIVDTLNV